MFPSQQELDNRLKQAKERARLFSDYNELLTARAYQDEKAIMDAREKLSRYRQAARNLGADGFNTLDTVDTTGAVLKGPDRLLLEETKIPEEIDDERTQQQIDDTAYESDDDKQKEQQPPDKKQSKNKDIQFIKAKLENPAGLDTTIDSWRKRYSSEKFENIISGLKEAYVKLDQGVSNLIPLVKKDDTQINELNEQFDTIFEGITILEGVMKNQGLSSNHSFKDLIKHMESVVEFIRNNRVDIIKKDPSIVNSLGFTKKANRIEEIINQKNNPADYQSDTSSTSGGRLYKKKPVRKQQSKKQSVNTTADKNRWMNSISVKLGNISSGNNSKKLKQQLKKQLDTGVQRKYITRYQADKLLKAAN